MKKKVQRLLIVALTVILITIPIISSDGIFPYAIQTETLDNGLEVVLVSMNSGGLIAYWSIARVGSRDEYEENRTGFAHFFEHMMFRGTVAYPANVYNAITTSIGASTNAFTTDDLTAYHLSISPQDLEVVMEIESDRFQNLSYPEEMFQTEAGAVYGEYRKNRMNPFFVVAEAVYREAFSKHTYGHTAMGYEEDIKEMPKLFDYSKSFFERHYRPENTILLIVGPIDPKTTMRMIRNYYGEWEVGYKPPDIPREPPQTAERRIEVPYQGKSLPIVWISYKADAFNPEDRYYVANSLLCEMAFGRASEIYKKLVLEEQVIEFIQARQNTNRDPGLIDIVTRIKDPAKVEYVISEIDRVIAEFKSKTPETGRLQELKSRLKYNFLMGLNTPSNVARSLVRWLAVSGTHQVVNVLHETAEKITPEDVLSAARKYLVSQKRTVAVLKGAN